MKTIWKYALDVEVEIEMPIGATVLSVGEQFGGPVLWAQVDSDAPMEQRTFRMIGTGHEFDGTGKFLGTIQMMSGALVVHVFEVTP